MAATTVPTKRPIPVPVEKALKEFYSYLVGLEEDLVCRTAGSKFHATKLSSGKKIDFLVQLKTIEDALANNLDLTISDHEKEHELSELVKAVHKDIDTHCVVVQCHQWVTQLLKITSNILNSTQHVNLEKLTELMEKNEDAGDCMEGKDVILLLGPAGSGKTTTLHYLAGTSFEETDLDGRKHYIPVDIVHPEAEVMKMSYGGCGQESIVTRFLQVAEINAEGRDVVICDTPSFGYHESVEEVIANSLGLVRALQKAKSVRPVLVLSHEEMAKSDRFIGYPNILAILERLVGGATSVDLEPFTCIFTKFDHRNTKRVEEQLLKFQEEIQNDKRELPKKYVIEYLNKHGMDPEERAIKPTAGDPSIFLRNLMERNKIVEPGSYFKPRISNNVTASLKRQLKFTLLNLRSSLAHDDNNTAIFRMGQLSDLANVLPEAGIYARHGFKAFKEVISKMVEEDVDEDYTADCELSTATEDSEESWTSTESEQWHNLSSKLLKKSSSVAPTLKTLSELEEEKEEEKEDISAELRQEEDNSKVTQGDEREREEEKTEAMESEESSSEAEASSCSSTGQSPQMHPEEHLSPISSPASSQKVGRELELSLSKDCSGISSLSSSSSESSGGEIDEDFAASAQSNCENGVHSMPGSHHSNKSESNYDGSESLGKPNTAEEGQASEFCPISQESEDGKLPEEDEEYAKDYTIMLRETIMQAVEQQDGRLALQKMQEFCTAIQGESTDNEEHKQFRHCVELSMRYYVALQERNYLKCLSVMKRLIKLGHDCPEAEKCSQFGLQAAVRHIVELRENVVDITNQIHETIDPDEFDRVLETLRVEREKVEQSDRLIEMCMKECDDKGKSETMLACISYGFKMGRTCRTSR